MVSGGCNLHQVMSQPHNCCVWHIETSVAICIPQTGLQHTHRPFSVDDGEMMQGPNKLFFVVCVMTNLQVITL